MKCMWLALPNRAARRPSQRRTHGFILHNLLQPWPQTVDRRQPAGNNPPLTSRMSLLPHRKSRPSQLCLMREPAVPNFRLGPLVTSGPAAAKSLWDGPGPAITSLSLALYGRRSRVQTSFTDSLPTYYPSTHNPNPPSWNDLKFLLVCLLPPSPPHSL